MLMTCALAFMDSADMLQKRGVSAMVNFKMRTALCLTSIRSSSIGCTRPALNCCSRSAITRICSDPNRVPPPRKEDQVMDLVAVCAGILL